MKDQDGGIEMQERGLLKNHGEELASEQDFFYFCIFLGHLQSQLLQICDLVDRLDLTRDLSECNTSGSKNAYKRKELRLKQFWTARFNIGKSSPAVLPWNNKLTNSDTSVKDCFFRTFEWA